MSNIRVRPARTAKRLSSDLHLYGLKIGLSSLSGLNFRDARIVREVLYYLVRLVYIQHKITMLYCFVNLMLDTLTSIGWSVLL